jgi:methyl-accepting chemotaxis protein PixJ
MTPQNDKNWPSSTSPATAFNLRAKAATFAVAAMLPVLGLGSAAYYIGQNTLQSAPILSETGATVLAQSAKQRSLQQSQLNLLLFGTVAMTLLSGGIAAFSIGRILRAATQQAKEIGLQTAQSLAAQIAQIHEAQTTADILKAAVIESRQALHCDRAVVLAFESDAAASVVAESVRSGWPKAFQLGSSDSCFGALYQQQYPNRNVKVFHDVNNAGLPPCYLERLQALSVRASLIAPLWRKDQIFGLLIVHQCDAPRRWQPSEIHDLAAIALQAGIALDRAYLSEQKQALQQQLDREVQWKTFLTDATQHLYESSTEEDVLNAAVEEARRVLDSDRVVVYSVDRESQGVIIAESVAPGWPRAFGRTIADPCFEARYIAQYANGRVRALNDIYSAGMTPCYIEQLERIAVKANLVAPVIHEGKLLGLFVAHQCSGPREWKDLEIRWFTQMSAQVGYALDNAKLLRRVDTMQEAASALQDERLQDRVNQSQSVQLVQYSKVALTDFAAKAKRQAEILASTMRHVQTVAEAFRLTATLTQKTDTQLQGDHQTLERGQQTLQGTLDSMAGIQETLTGANLSLQEMSKQTQQANQCANLLRQLLGQVTQQAIHASIEAGRSTGESTPGSFANTTKAVLLLCQQMKTTLETLDRQVAGLGNEAALVSHGLESGLEQAADGEALTQEARQSLRRLEETRAQVSVWIQQVLGEAAAQLQTTAYVYQMIQQSINQSTHASEQASTLAETLVQKVLAEPE